MRKLVTALALTGVVFVTPLAYGLGLGDIEVFSALNQPLEAEIKLTSVRPGETDGLIVKLASEDAFLQAGVERPFYLTKLKFDLAVRPDGTQYLKVTTNNPLREPFLNFLIDIDWPRGRLVREYTILLDPPVFASQQKAAPQVAPAQDFGAAGVDDAATDIPDIESESAVGEPALIERDTPVDSGLPEIPDIEASATTAEADVAPVAEEEPLEEDAFDFTAEEEQQDFEIADEVGEVDAEITDDSPDFVATQESEEAFFDTEAADAGFDEESEAAFEELDTLAEGSTTIDDRLSEQSLPDIEIELDDTLSYDVDATDALLAQFAAEDATGATEEQVDFIEDEPVEEVSDYAADADGNEYEVEAGDTLGQIAERYRSPDVSLDQAMLAILRNNPDAFIRGNINNVKKGFVLRIPDQPAMLELSSAEALEEVKRQNALWREYKEQFAGAASTEQDIEAADQLLRAERDLDEPESEGAQLSLLSPGRDADSGERVSGQQEGIESGDSTSLDLQLAREELEAERLEKVELQERLTELNEQLLTMERLISLKNEQLAQLQEQLGEAGAESADIAVDDGLGLEEDPLTAEDDSGLSLQGEQQEAGTFEDDPLSEDFEFDTAAEQDAAEEPLDLNADAGISDFDESTDPLDSTALEEDAGFEDEFASDAGFEDEFGTEATDSGFDEELSAQGAESAQTEDEVIAEEVEEPVQAEPVQTPTGIAGFVHDLLPPPYNKMVAGLFNSPYGLGILVVIIVLIIGIPILLLNPRKKAAKPIIGAGAETAAATATEKASLGDRLKSMFAPITGIFAKKEKAVAEPFVDEPIPEEELPEAAEDVITGSGDNTEDAYEETVKKAAEPGEDDTEGETFTEKTTAISMPVDVAEPEPEPEEEVSDDTTAEADVYLAYGLFDQAEELLTQSLASSPDKIEYKGKLLETYFAAGKKAEFENLAAEVNTALAGRSSRIWEKAVAMGKEIAPDNSLFSGETASDLKASDFVPAKPETADLDLSDSQGETTPDIKFDETVAAASTDTDFDLDLGDSESDAGFDETVADVDQEALGGDDLSFDLADDQPAPQAEEAPAEDAELDIDFNADELGLDMGEGMGENHPEPTVAMHTNTDTNFDLDDEAEEAGEAEGQQEEAAAADDAGSGSTDLDLDLGDLKLDEITDVDEAGEQSAGEGLIAELDSADDESDAPIDTEFEISMNEDTLIDTEIDDDTLGGGDTETGIDEVSTKLDLAKAYMDMGDFDGASSTLEEVMAEGNQGQRREAEELLDQIN